jgi:hypothetical protein
MLAAFHYGIISKNPWKERCKMLEMEFKNFLQNDPELTGEHGVPYRMSKARKAEEMLGANLDTVVADDDSMYDALMKLKPLENPAKNPMQNALRKYYIFKNGREFPRLNQYKR